MLKVPSTVLTRKGIGTMAYSKDKSRQNLSHLLLFQNALKVLTKQLTATCLLEMVLS